jgi:hypothetical protein
MERFDAPRDPEVLWGLGISVGVVFGVEPMDNYIDLHSAGCDFLP